MAARGRIRLEVRATAAAARGRIRLGILLRRASNGASAKRTVALEYPLGAWRSSGLLYRLPLDDFRVALQLAIPRVRLPVAVVGFRRDVPWCELRMQRL